MAAIIEGHTWHLEDWIAEVMVEEGLLVKCQGVHIDLPNQNLKVYHFSSKKPDWFGSSTVGGTIQRIKSEDELQKATPSATGGALMAITIALIIVLFLILIF